MFGNPVVTLDVAISEVNLSSRGGAGPGQATWQANCWQTRSYPPLASLGLPPSCQASLPPTMTSSGCSSTTSIKISMDSKASEASHASWTARPRKLAAMRRETQLHCGVTPGPAVCNLAAPAFWRKWRKTGRLLGCLWNIMKTISSESWRRWSQVMTRWGGDVAWQRQILKCWRKLLSIWRLKIGRRGFLMTAWRQQFNTGWKLLLCETTCALKEPGKINCM